MIDSTHKILFITEDSYKECVLKKDVSDLLKNKIGNYTGAIYKAHVVIGSRVDEKNKRTLLPYANGRCLGFIEIDGNVGIGKVSIIEAIGEAIGEFAESKDAVFKGGQALVTSFSIKGLVQYFKLTGQHPNQPKVVLNSFDDWKLFLSIDSEGSLLVKTKEELMLAITPLKSDSSSAAASDNLAKEEKDKSMSPPKKAGWGNFFYLIGTAINPFSAFFYLSAIVSGLWKKGFWGALGALTVASLSILTLGLSNFIVFPIAFLIRRRQSVTNTTENDTLAKASNYGWSLVAVLLLVSILAVVLLPFYPLSAIGMFVGYFIQGGAWNEKGYKEDPENLAAISSAIRPFGLSKLYNGITAFIGGIDNLLSLNKSKMNDYQKIISTNFACYSCIAITNRVLIPASHALLACLEVPILAALKTVDYLPTDSRREYMGMYKLMRCIFSIPGIIVGLLIAAVAIAPLAILFFGQVIIESIVACFSKNKSETSPLVAKSQRLDFRGLVKLIPNVAKSFEPAEIKEDNASPSSTLPRVLS